MNDLLELAQACQGVDLFHWTNVVAGLCGALLSALVRRPNNARRALQ